MFPVSHAEDLHLPSTGTSVRRRREGCSVLSPVLWQDCCHGLACATPPPAGQGHQAGWLLAGIQGKKALSEVYQAITLLFLRALNNKYLQKSNGSSAPSLTSEEELSSVLFPMVGELGRCTWQVVTSHLCQVTHFHHRPFCPPFLFPSYGMFLGSRPHGKHL